MPDQPADDRDEQLQTLAAILDPLDRALAFKALIKVKGTLSPAESAVYRATLAELHGDRERRPSWIARKVGMSTSTLRAHIARHLGQHEVSA